jgi:hypothetical protein
VPVEQDHDHEVEVEVDHEHAIDHDFGREAARSSEDRPSGGSRDR